MVGGALGSGGLAKIDAGRLFALEQFPIFSRVSISQSQDFDPLDELRKFFGRGNLDGWRFRIGSIWHFRPCA